MSYDTQLLRNYIPLNFLEKINSLIEEDLKRINEDDRINASHGNYYKLSETTTQLIKDVLPLLPRENPAIHLLVHTGPTGPHADTNIGENDTYSDPKRFARTMIIPLYTQNTSTIVFDQTLPAGSEGSIASEFIKTLPVINKIDEEMIDKYFSFSESMRIWLNKLSVETIFPWVAGDVLIFDRNKLHTGDNHIKNGMTEKKGLIIWTEII